MKTVLDTNCLLRAVANRSDYHCILTALQQGRYTLCCTNDICFYGRRITGQMLNFIAYSMYTLKVTPYYSWNLIATDPDDNKFVDCALNAGGLYGF